LNPTAAALQFIGESRLTRLFKHRINRRHWRKRVCPNEQAF
jgi:hypothetical protein